MNNERYRHELKYIVSEAELCALRARIKGILRPDPHADLTGRYQVRSIYFDDLDMKKETLLFAKCGMEWLALCEDRNVRAHVIPGYAIILMKYKEYSIIYEPMKESMPILLKMNKPDYALIVAAYLTMIEYQKFGMDPKDIWYDHESCRRIPSC